MTMTHRTILHQRFFNFLISLVIGNVSSIKLQVTNNFFNNQ